MSDDDDSSGWQLTESDPGVFTELLKAFKVNLIVDDLYSLDEEALSAFRPVHALIFLFKWVSNSDETGGASGTYDENFPGFFAHQVVNNACATLAVMNALLNIPDIVSANPPKMGDELVNLLNFTAGMDATTKGLAITSSDFIREKHNSLSPPSAVSLDGLSLPKTSEDAYHFIVYVPVAGNVYELDGLKPHPVNHGKYVDGGEGWVAKAREVIQARIATYPLGALEFNLLVIHDDVLPKLQAELGALQASGNDVLAAEVVSRISQENEKRSRWAFENSLRRHNYVGLIHALTLALAKSGSLTGATSRAKMKMKERTELSKKTGKEMDVEDI